MRPVFKDPVCGMIVLPEKGIGESYDGQTLYFCSIYCQEKFHEYPERYLSAVMSPAEGLAKGERTIAYFSMEVAIDTQIPSYSGGLGVLAGDTLHSFADLSVPAVGVTLLSRKGYFDQFFDEGGRQHERPVNFDPHVHLRSLTARANVEVGGRNVQVGAWEYDVLGVDGYQVPLILLDTDLEGNSEYDRRLTDHLYGGNAAYRLAQEIVLGLGGVRILHALGYTDIQRFHMNEGHASLLVLELLRGLLDSESTDWGFEDVRSQAVFTTHTPVAAGHDEFDYELVHTVLGTVVPFDVLQMFAGRQRLNMTLLALNLSRYVNGVARRHGEVSREMFPGYPIDHITNGVHSLSWTCESFQRLYDDFLPGWRNDPAMLRKAVSFPSGKIWEAHSEAKQQLLRFIGNRTDRSFAADVLTIGFARRATLYKRADLIFSDVARLVQIAKETGRMQFVFAGKAHPHDEEGKELIRRIIAISNELRPDIPIVFLENYDMQMAKQIVSGVDLWLNTPQLPLEASGTSGMKAAHNGVPSFSTLDGWWLEGCVEGVTGWSIGSVPPQGSDLDASDLYHKLQSTIIPLFYRQRERWIEVMRHSIALNASYFNTHRMVQQYVTNAYLR